MRHGVRLLTPTRVSIPMQKHLHNLDLQHEHFVIAHLQREWEEAERSLKRHELATKAKIAAEEVGRVLLSLLLAGGVLAAACVAPNVMALVAPKRGMRRYVKRDMFRKKLREQSSKSYLRYEQSGENEFRVTLTPKGKRRALDLALRHFALRRAKQWDGRWRIAMFDIPKKHDGLRDALRHKLEEIGMVRIQDSVFAYPYPCADEILFWAELYGVMNEIYVGEASFTTALDREVYERFSLKTP